MKRFRIFGLASAALALAIAGAGAQARADISLTITEGSETLTITQTNGANVAVAVTLTGSSASVASPLKLNVDNVALTFTGDGTQNTNVALIDFANTLMVSTFGGTKFGDYMLNSLEVDSNPATPNPNTSQLVNTTAKVTGDSTSQANLSVAASSSFSVPNPGNAFNASLISTLSSSTLPAGMLSMQSTINPGTPSHGATISINSVTGATDITQIQGLSVPFTLGNTVTISGIGANQIEYSGNTQLYAPEPATAAMALTALPLAVFALRRRKRAA